MRRPTWVQTVRCDQLPPHRNQQCLQSPTAAESFRSTVSILVYQWAPNAPLRPNKTSYLHKQRRRPTDLATTPAGSGQDVLTYIDPYIRVMPTAANVFERDTIVVGEVRGDFTDRRFESVRTRLQMACETKCLDNANQSVATHPQIADIVEKHDCRGYARSARWGQPAPTIDSLPRGSASNAPRIQSDRFRNQSSVSDAPATGSPSCPPQRDSDSPDW